MSENKNRINISWGIIWYIGMLIAIGIVFSDPTANYSSAEITKIFIFGVVGWPVYLGIFIGTIAFKMAGIK